jgi:hypothetical protein
MATTYSAQIGNTICVSSNNLFALDFLFIFFFFLLLPPYFFHGDFSRAQKQGHHNRHSKSFESALYTNRLNTIGKVIMLYFK